jgi:hypothetical protein
MKTNHLATLLSALVLTAPATLHAADDSRDATQPGDPARWAQPIETPRQMYENTLKEARNAMADAMKECRADASTRKACEIEARAQYDRDVKYARQFLTMPSSGVKQ